VWVDGGWGIDALLGRQTRPHDDLDLIAVLEHVPRLEQALGEAGYARANGEPPTSFELVDPLGPQVDVHPVRVFDDGSAVYTLADGRPWPYAPGRLAGEGAILGRPVPCPTPETALRNHTTGYVLDAAHLADATALAEHYGLALPEGLATLEA
jgi:lincosamide nucleotidyltransferase A/C/D/E